MTIPCTKKEVFHYEFFQVVADLVTLTEEILNGKLHLLFSDSFGVNRGPSFYHFFITDFN